MNKKYFGMMHEIKTCKSAFPSSFLLYMYECRNRKANDQLSNKTKLDFILGYVTFVYFKYSNIYQLRSVKSDLGNCCVSLMSVFSDV